MRKKTYQEITDTLSQPTIYKLQQTQTQPTFEMTPGFKPFTIYELLANLRPTDGESC